MENHQGHRVDGPTGDWPTTGDDTVDAQLAALDGLADLPAGEHQAVYAVVHDALRRVLDEDPTQP